MLFARWEKPIENDLYVEFTSGTNTELEQQLKASDSHLLKKGAEFIHKKLKIQRNENFYVFEENARDPPFSLRSFLFSLAMLSNLTASEKLRAIFGLLDFRNQGLDMKDVKLAY